ncbi:MAG: phytanoyl-CoA dioxygenase family protein [Burkholderiales bacterium]
MEDSRFSLRNVAGRVADRIAFLRARAALAAGQDPKALRFDPGTLPWIDRPDADVAAYVAALGDRAPADYDLREQLACWREHGYVIFRKLIPESWIDAFVADMDRLVAERARMPTRVMAEGMGIRPISEFTLDEIEGPHVRVIDFHNQSVAAKRIILHPRIVEFIEHLFRDTVVAMQTLTYWRSSEQHTHQDFAYVVANIASQMCATWVALEDVDADAGPLEYFPGSQRLPMFDFGNGMFATTESTRTEIEFRDYLERECEARGLQPVSFTPRKGDVLFWHAALAHRGGQVRDRALTRKSLVSHYSTATAYPWHRRALGRRPRICRYGRGLVYADPHLTGAEDTYPFAGNA